MNPLKFIYTLKETDPELARREYITRWVLFFSLIASSCFTLISFILYLFSKMPLDTLLIYTYVAVMFAIAIFVTNAGYWRTAGIIPPLLMYFPAVNANYIGGIDAPGNFMYALMIIFVGIIYGYWKMWIAVVICLATYLCLAWMIYAGYIKPYRTAEVVFINRVVLVSGFLVGIALMVWLLGRSYRSEIDVRIKAEELLNRKNEELGALNEALREKEERYRTIFEGTATSNIIVAEDTTILMANHNFANLVGFTKQELEGKISWTRFVVREDLERLKNNQKMRRQDPESVPSSYELRAINRKGEIRDLFMSVAVIPETKESVVSLIDLTNIKRLETQLIQAQKMESVGRLAGGVAHDFNNMLSVILGHTEMAISKVNRSDPLYRVLQEVLNAGRRSADLTRQLLAFARKQTVSPKVLDLNDTVAGMLKMLQRLIGEDISLNWRPAPRLWKVKIDPSQVDQILANLTVNARDAIEKTGRITIETSNRVCDEAYKAVHPESVPGEYVLLALSDDGCGMDKETLANIFEPFFTTKKEGQGTGLGLATVYGIVKQNGGFIYVYSEPAQGTTFRIYLPRHVDESAESPDENQKPEIQTGTETILIVEDEEVVLNLTKSMLEMLGYRVLTAKGAAQALRLVGEFKEDIDLLLTDVVMPDLNGKELSERIMAIKPGLKCLFMSGYTADIIARQGVLEEGVNFIPKPFSLQDLAIKVREALGG